LLDDEIDQLVNNRLRHISETPIIIELALTEILSAISQTDSSIQKVFLALGSRTYNHLLSAVTLFRVGLLTDAEACVRGALESMYLLEYLMQDEQRRQAWLDGKRFSPSRVRKALLGSDLREQRYGFLSERTHPNKAGLSTHAQLVAEKVFIAIGPSLPRTATILAFTHILETEWSFLRILTNGLRVVGDTKVYVVCARAADLLEELFPEFRAILANASHSQTKSEAG